MTPAVASPRPRPRSRPRGWRAALANAWLALIAAPLDAGLVWLAFRTSHVLRAAPAVLDLAPLADKTLEPWSSYSGFISVMIPVWLVLFLRSAKLYDAADLPLEDRAVRVLRGAAEGTVFTLASSFLYQRFSDSRLLILMAWPLATVYVFAGHALIQSVYRWARRRFTEPTPTLVVGEGRAANALIRRLMQLNHRRLMQTGSLTLDSILDYVDRYNIAEVILVRASLSQDELVDLGDAMETRGVGLRIVPSLLDLRMGEVQIDRSLGAPSITFFHSSLSGENAAVKRAFDIVFCFVFFVVFAAPLALICLLIKLDSRGPILFRQRRVGYKGRTFELFKFRTMHEDAERRLEELRHLNERKGPVFKIKCDPRVTRLGWWLRRLSIDEIPQFLNVLKGEMSVVGPRPPLPVEVEEYDEAAMRRLNVRPGITGLWQVSGRADLDFEQMIALDLFYIEHWSLGMDLHIILRTAPAMVGTRGAY